MTLVSSLRDTHHLLTMLELLFTIVKCLYYRPQLVNDEEKSFLVLTCGQWFGQLQTENWVFAYRHITSALIGLACCSTMAI
jgi:hypothetical protein